MTWPVFEYRLRHCPGEVRVVLAAFLLLTASGYTAAVYGVGSAPTGISTAVHDRYAGRESRPVSKAERLLDAADGPFNGTGTMRPAFTTRSDGWAGLIRDLAGSEREKLAAEREGERLVLVAWIRAGADRVAYDRDEFDPGAELTGQPVTPDLAAGAARVKIRSLIERRCVTCHADAGREDRARLIPFDTYDRLRPAVATPIDPQLPLRAFTAETAERVPILAPLFAATGVLVCFTAMPTRVRRVVAPLPLAAAIVACGCAWLARWDGAFAWGVVAGGAAAGLAVPAHLLAIGWELVRSDCGPGPGRVECGRPTPTGR